MTKRIIDDREYLFLLKRDAMLVALEEGGVDNWSWYGECYDRYKEILKEMDLDEEDD